MDLMIHYIKGFNDYQQALTVARMHLGMNFYILDSLKHYTEPPVTYLVTKDTSQILFCDHCETMKNNYKILNEENLQTSK